MNEPIKKQDPRRGATSASAAPADRRCPGRHIAQRGLASPPPTEDAQFGTQIHDALAKDDPSGLKPDQLSIYEQCLDIRNKKIEEFFGNDAPNVKLIRERRLWCKVLAKPGDKKPNAERYEHSGQVDLVARLGARGLVVEYKTLPGEVEESPSNEQLRDQVVLSARNLIMNEVGATVIQPLITHDANICLYNAEAITKAEQEMFVRVRNSNDPLSPRTANAVSCKFCLAKNQCLEYERWASSMVPDTTVITATPVVQWTPEMRAHFCQMRPSAQRWLDECDAEMKRLLKEDPKSVPGWALVPGKARSPISDAQELFRRFVELAKPWAESEVPDKNPAEVNVLLTTLFMDCVKISKEGLEYIVRKTTKLKGKGLFQQMEKLTEGITNDKQDQPSLKRIT